MSTNWIKLTPEERSERMSIFLTMAAALPSSKQTLDNVYRIICKYDLPKHVDREFIFDCLIEYFCRLEEYEKCAELLKYKLNNTRSKRITAKNLDRKDLADLRLLGFQIPDSVKVEVLKKPKNNDK